MTVINTNIAAQVTANAMKSNARVMENTMERLATGSRINSASDDAAGLAIGSKMESQIRGLSQAVRNANDGISLIQTADGASIEISNMLQRMRELSVQALNETNQTSTDVVNLNKEFASLATEIDRIANDTEFNGIKLLDGSISGDSLDFIVGDDEADKITVSFSDFNLANGGAAVAETPAKVTTANTLGEIRADLGGAGVFVTDAGGQTIHVDLNDVKADGGRVAATSSDATHAEVAAALQAAATRNSSFQFGTVVATAGTDGFILTAKAGQGATANGNVTYTGTATGSGGSGADVYAAGAFTTAGVTATGQGVMKISMTAYADSTSSTVSTTGTIAALDNAILGVSEARADFGSVVNTLEYSIDNLNNAIANTAAAKSSVMDADYAAETTELARTQIISQAATAMLSQANQSAQSVLALLK